MKLLHRLNCLNLIFGFREKFKKNRKCVWYLKKNINKAWYSKLSSIPFITYLTTIKKLDKIIFMSLFLLSAASYSTVYYDKLKTCSFFSKDTDWGIFQMEAVIDRKDINGNHFLVMTNFGEHTLHHLFPTLDHEVLPHLNAVFHKTCEDFDTFHRVTTQGHLVLGQFQQLSRTHTNGPEERASYWRSLLTK